MSKGLGMSVSATITACKRPLMLAAALIALAGPATSLDQLDLKLRGTEDDEVRSALRNASLLVQLEAEDEDDPRDLLAAAQADYTRMIEALYALGYYSAVVRILVDGREAAEIPPLSAPSDISRIVIDVAPGKPFRFGQAAIAPVAPGDALIPEFRRGKPALATTVRDAALGAVTGWREAGYAKAEIADQTITARHSDARLDVDVDVAPGRRLSFGDVIVRGESAVRSARVRQIAGIPRGEQFSPSDVERAAERLRRTGTFRSVQVSEAETAAPDGSLDVFIDVTDRKPRRFGAGVELSTFDGLTLSGFWLHRNLLGGAERFRVEGEATQLGGQGGNPDFSLSARFEKPAVYGPDTLFFAYAGLDYLDEPDFISESAEIGLGVSQEFSPTLTGELGIELSYQRVTDLFLPKLPNGEHPTRELLLFSVPTALTWDTRNNELDATAGYFLRAELEPFVSVEDGDGGARLEFDGRVYRGFGEGDRTVLAARLQFGSLYGPDATDAPPDFLYYSGGGGTVRGQPFRSLDADYGTTRLGGRSFVGLSGEVRFDVTDTIGLVAFADAGYVGTESFYDGSGEWHSGGGLGLRYNTPVGPIRLDIAGPISGDTSDGVQLYVGIGQAF